MTDDDALIARRARPVDSDMAALDRYRLVAGGYAKMESAPDGRWCFYAQAAAAIAEWTRLYSRVREERDRAELRAEKAEAERDIWEERAARMQRERDALRELANAAYRKDYLQAALDAALKEKP